MKTAHSSAFTERLGELSDDFDLPISGDPTSPENVEQEIQEQEEVDSEIGMELQDAAQPYTSAAEVRQEHTLKRLPDGQILYD